MSARQVVSEELKKCVEGDSELGVLAKMALQSFIKAYTVYPRQLKSIFYVQNLDFAELSRCFFVQRQQGFLRKGGMKQAMRRARDKRGRESMRDVAQKLTKKRNMPSTVSEFASF